MFFLFLFPFPFCFGMLANSRKKSLCTHRHRMRGMHHLLLVVVLYIFNVVWIGGSMILIVIVINSMLSIVMSHYIISIYVYNIYKNYNTVSFF